MACRSRRSTPRSPSACALIITVDCGTTSVAEFAAAQRPRDRRDRHRPPSRPAGPPGGGRHRQPAPRRLDLPGPPSGGERRRVQGRAAPARATSRAGRPRPSTSRTSPRSARRGRRADRRREPGDRPAGSRADASRAAARDRRAAGARPDRARRRVDLETVVVRARPAAQRRRPGGGGARGGPAPARRRPGRGGDPRRCPRGRQPDPPRPDEDGRRRGAGGGRRRRRTRRHRRPRTVDRRDRRAGRGAAGRGPRRGRPSSAPSSATSIRASCRSDGRSTWAPPWSAAPTCSSASAATPAPPASSSPADRWDAFRERFLARARRRSAPPDPRGPIAIDLALPALDVDYALFRELAALAPCGPGNPEPLVAVLGLTVTRVRRPATGGHSQLTLRRDRDVLDGIAFGRLGHRRGRPRGRSSRCRRAADQPARSAASSRSSSTSATSRPSGSHPEAADPCWHPRDAALAGAAS